MPDQIRTYIQGADRHLCRRQCVPRFFVGWLRILARPKRFSIVGVEAVYNLANRWKQVELPVQGFIVLRDRDACCLAVTLPRSDRGLRHADGPIIFFA